MNIAITQNNIIYGGRLAVIVGIIKVLNRRGIVPDVITFRTEMSADKIEAQYGIRIKFRLIVIETWQSRIPGELNIIAFNAAIRKIYHRYDYLIDSNNTSFLLPPDIPVLSYVHFPRKARLKSQLIDIHQPHGDLKKWSVREGMLLKSIGILYNFHRIRRSNLLLANSRFTQETIKRYYPHGPQNISVIYPPAYRPTAQFDMDSLRSKSVCSLGRFCESKNQMAQIKLFQHLPDWELHLIGFSGKNNPYLNQCTDYIRQTKLKNIFLHVNTSNSEKTNIMRKMKFFIHSNINEPFGISTVEAINHGCIPLAHNSGGQIEIIPFKELRFDHLAEIKHLLQNATSDEDYMQSLRRKLINHCHKNFSQDAFQNNIMKQLLRFESKLLGHGNISNQN